MTTEIEQKIQVRGIHFENPLRKNVIKATATITVSRKRFGLIQSRMGVITASSGEPGEDLRKLFLLGLNVANILMPSLVHHVLKETLTPRQYQRALRANQEGKILKFARARK
ncbi:MAG: hypothetical protein HYT08_04305 [Candidatus Levybacteria bacterium]|nr:hypothetical protein [Candidatus Levybacteria bacterium]